MLVACMAEPTSFAEHFQHSAEDHFGSYCDHRSGRESLPWHSDFTERANQFRRVGEARHPGPQCFFNSLLGSEAEMDAVGLVRFGTTNPSGLRQKESLAVEHGVGVWGYSETQLSQITQKTCSHQLRALAATQNRRLRIFMGAPADTRSSSSWAGAWTGVLTTSDFASQIVHLPWQDEEYKCGRVVTSRHLIHGIPFLQTTIYGFARGPTYPSARDHTTQLLNRLTLEVVIGGRGPRLIVGDYNFASEELEVFQQWRAHGWESIQTHAARHLGWGILPTSKRTQERDMIWLSPEALALAHSLQVEEVFAEHSSLSVNLALPRSSPTLMIWPKPSKIPWSLVKDDWTGKLPTQWVQGGTSEEIYAQIFASMEKSLDGCIIREDQPSLIPQERGRGQRTGPQKEQHTPNMARPSREGEVQLRSNLVGGLVVKWFKQLRRLQALRHSLHSDHQSLNSEVYQLEVWSSVCHAKGFEGGFRSWWQHHRRFATQDVPTILPSGPPNVSQIDQIYETFQMCFRSFESWHLRRRGQQLTLKYDRTLKQLYQDLKAPQKPGVDMLNYEHQHQILAIDPESQLVHLDGQIDTRGTSQWSVDGEPVRVVPQGGELCEIHAEFPLHNDSIVTQKQFLAKIPDVHQELLDHWNARWNTTKQPTPSEWSRIVAFFCAFIPTISFDLPPITPALWRSSLKRFRSNAARGADGVSSEDLVRLPLWLTVQLLDLLTRIEAGDLNWPPQLLYGIVICIAKVADPHEATEFRPVVIFGVCYRAWSSIRARQLLRQLAPYVPDTCFGFIPSCECPQLWMRLQSLVELAVQTDSLQCGLSTDLKKAFNTIPRPHTFELAEKLGVPKLVTLPWRRFLDCCTRSFTVGPYHSPTISSNTGMPEGCAMSVFAMVQLCLAFHTYMDHFSGGMGTLTYVDNICLIAQDVASLSGAWVCLQSFFELWKMEFDPTKTYTWSTAARQRKELRVFPFPCHTYGSEVGGAMNFGKKHRQVHLYKRLESLPDLWLRLKNSKAPIWQKMRALPSVLWARALHGNDAHLLASAHFQQLRGQALLSLKFKSAGVNGYLRLLAYGDFNHDPEFFHIQRTLGQFRRICRKEPILWSQWHQFMQLYDGHLHDGPFSKLLALFAQLGWCIQPPYFYDGDGCRHHLQHLDSSVLEILLKEAWLQFVSSRICHRATMKVTSLDLFLWDRLFSGLDAFSQSTIAALASGAFVDNAKKSKFDTTKEANCPFCGHRDLQEHWPLCPGYLQYYDSPADISLVKDLPLPRRTHLLTERSPLVAEVKNYLCELPDLIEEFHSSPSCGIQEIFTDGSHQPHQHHWLGWSAWIVLNASTGLVIAGGPVSGLHQGSDVAELSAALSALCWASLHQVPIRCWIDSKFVVDSMEWLWRHRFIPAQWSNHRLWELVLEQFDQLHEHPPEFRWIPSHVDSAASPGPCEDWWISWNDRADREACRLNHTRSEYALKLKERLTLHYEEKMIEQTTLRTFYLNLAKDKISEKPSQSSTESPELIASEHLVSFRSLLGEGWQAFLKASLTDRKDLPSAFFEEVVSWLTCHENTHGTVFQLSYLELTFGLIRDDVKFPFGSCESWHMQKFRDRMVRPTLASLLSVVRRLFRRLCFLFDVEERLVTHLDLSAFSVSIPMDGISLCLSADYIHSLREDLVQFTGRRGIKRSCDLARPP